jgi:hypothetical protein
MDRMGKLVPYRVASCGDEEDVGSREEGPVEP